LSFLMFGIKHKVIMSVNPNTIAEQVSQWVEKIGAGIREIILERFKIDISKLQQKNPALGKDLGIDSLETVEFLMQIEDTFEIRIPDEEYQKLVTYGDAIQCILIKRIEKEYGITIPSAVAQKLTTQEELVKYLKEQFPAS